MENVRSRKTSRRLLKSLARAIVHARHLSHAEKAILIGVGLSILSLCLPWVSIGVTSYSAFSLISGRVGVLIAAICAFELFLLLSYDHKEQVKSLFRMWLSDHAFALFGGILMMVTSAVVLETFFSLDLWQSQYTVGRGPVLSIVAGIVVVVGGILRYREEKRELEKTLYVDHPASDEEQEYRKMLDGTPKEGSRDDAGNMSLPL